MGKGIKEAGGAQELQPVSLSELIHQHVRVAIETAVHEELRAALGTIATSAVTFDVATAMASGSGRSRTDRPGRTHVASRYPLQRRRWDRMDLDDRPALSAANAGGQ